MAPTSALRRRLLAGLALVAVLAAGAAVRLATWPWVLGHDEVRFASDGDALYHVLQAERLERDGLDAVWEDARLNHPLGAVVPWPPLFDALLALAGRAGAAGAAPDRATLEAAAMWVPPLLGLLTLLATCGLARALLGGRAWLDAALVLALLPAHAAVTALGRPDHHALEPLLLALVLVAAGRIAAGRPGRAPEALLAAAAALAFWNWNGSALYLALVTGFAAAWHLLAGPDDPGPGRAAARLAAGLGAGAAALGLSVALLVPARVALQPGLSGLTALQPALVAGAAAACALLALARRARPGAGPWARALAAAAALLLPPALLLLLPWTRDGVGRGLAMLGAAGWYRSIAEFQPLLPSGLRSMTADALDLLAWHGLALLAVPAALPLLWRRWRGGPVEGRGPALLAALAFAGTLALAWLRSRFTLYLALAEALAVVLLARQVATWATARWPARRWAGGAAGAALAALLLAPVVPGLATAAWSAPNLARYTDVAPLLRLADAVPRPPGREAVLSSWSDGHDVLYFTRLPAVSSPFGVEGGAGALQADAAFHTAASQAEAEAVLGERRVGLVLLTRPIDEVLSLADLAPPGRPPLVARAREADGRERVLVDPAFNELVATRLWLWDGMRGGLDGRPLDDGRPAVDGFRLLGESSTPSLWHAVAPPLFKLFQPVAGLRLAVEAAPGAVVEAWTELRTAAGRRETWRTRAVADPAGRAALRLPYATGRNGEVEASAWQVGDGRRWLELPVTEQDVLGGRHLALSLRR